MFIGVLHDNTDMDKVKKLASEFLGDDVSKGGFTGAVAIEQFMATGFVEPRWPMYLTCFYALPEEETEGMSLILANEFFGGVVNVFTRKVAEEKIYAAMDAMINYSDGRLAEYFGQIKEQEDAYWNFLALLSIQFDVRENVNLVAYPLAGREIPVVYYELTSIGSSYIRGFENGMRAKQEEERAKHPEFANVVTFKSKK